MPSLVQSFTSFSFRTGTASTAFVENKLSRSLFSLSLLFTTHPRSLQRTLVRPSMNCYTHFSLVMNSSLRFVSLTWESSRIFFCLAFTLFSRFRFNFSPSSKLVDPLYHKYSVILLRFLFVDSQWISVVQFLVRSLTVLFTINHVYFPLSLVGGSTFFHPHFMYEFTRTFCFLLLYGIRFLPFGRLFTLFHFVFHRIPLLYQFRSPLLSVSRLISFVGTKMFQFPTFFSLFCMLSHVWYPELLSFRISIFFSIDLLQAYRSV